MTLVAPFSAKKLNNYIFNEIIAPEMSPAKLKEAAGGQIKITQKIYNHVLNTISEQCHQKVDSFLKSPKGKEMLPGAENYSSKALYTETVSANLETKMNKLFTIIADEPTKPSTSWVWTVFPLNLIA